MAAKFDGFDRNGPMGARPHYCIHRAHANTASADTRTQTPAHSTTDWLRG